MISYETNKLGTVTFEGRSYDLKAEADFTNHQIPNWKTEEGYAEFSAPAIDENGNEVTVYWVLKTVYENGEGIEDLGELDWGNVDRVAHSGN